MLEPRTALELPLIVLGAANYESPVEANLARIAANDSRVRVVGHVDNRDEFFTLLGAARGYLHGHSVGGINPSLVEAMHSGARIAALDTPFNRETLGDTGEFFTVGSLDATLTALLAEPDSIAAAKRRCATDRASQRFSVEQVVNAYETLLINVAGAPARRSYAMTTQWNEHNGG